MRNVALGLKQRLTKPGILDDQVKVRRFRIAWKPDVTHHRSDLRRRWIISVAISVTNEALRRTSVHYKQPTENRITLPETWLSQTLCSTEGQITVYPGIHSNTSVEASHMFGSIHREKCYALLEVKSQQC